MTTIPYSPTEISALRKEVALYGVRLDQKQAWTLLRKVGHRPLCVDALLMDPRPGWVAEIAGPLPEKAKAK